MQVPQVVQVRPVGGYRLFLRFDDGTSGEVDVSDLIEFRGVFAPMSDASEFERVRVDESSATVVWACGADLDPIVLYAAVKGVRVDELLDAEDPVEA